MPGMRVARLALALIAATVLVGVLVPTASAETTHKFLRTLNLPGGEGVMPLGVDPQGNLIVWFDSNSTIHKFSPNGTPVNFSALGTNVLDGAGAGTCESTPSSCDRDPIDGFGSNAYSERYVAADMDQSNGPTAGYIYVEATYGPFINFFGGESYRGHLYVFDSTGRYRGEIDTTQASPDTSPNGISQGISVSPGGGNILVTYSTQQFNVNDESNFHVDKYAPVDGNPAHDAFVGQLRRQSFGSALNEGGFGLMAVADDEYAYVEHGNPAWEKFDAASFAQPTGGAFPINLSPNGCTCPEAGPWGKGGIDEEFGSTFEFVSIDPATHDAYLFDRYSGYIGQWSPQNTKIGQLFGGPEVTGGYFGPGQYVGRPFAFDTSSTATKGRIYMANGPTTLAVFSPSVAVPDVNGLQATPTHTGGHVTATIDLAHGPSVNKCQIQWGEATGGPVVYSSSTSCTPATPYGGETAISGDVTGLETGHEYKVRIVARTINGLTKSNSVPLTPPAVLSTETLPATEVTRTTALLHGSLDADSLPTTYYFQYGIDTNYRSKTAESSAGSGSGSAEVSPVEIASLQSGRTYHFRLVAVNSLGTTYGPDQSFVAASAPAISGVNATHVEESSAMLAARVDPGGYETTYHFEYGTSIGYGTDVPAPDESIGSGSEPVQVSANLSGLQPGATYHFRVVAENKWGRTVSEDSTFGFFPPDCPNEYQRQLTGSNYLPDCRAYELVSPGNAGAVQLLPGNVLQDFQIFKSNAYPHLRIPPPNLGQASSPPRFSFLGAIGAVSGTNPPNSLVDLYTSTRTLTGWHTTYWGLKGNEAAFVGAPQCNLEMSVCIDYRLPDLAGPAGDPTDKGSLAPYVWDAEGNSLGRWPTNLKLVKGAEEYVGDGQPSPDFSHYVFSSRNIAFAEGGLTAAPGSVYDNDISEATVQIVSRLNGGEDIPQDAGTSSESIAIPAISTDGSHILMSTLATGGVHLYMRVNDALTYQIGGEGSTVKFIAMTSDGSKVVFSSTEPLTTDDHDSSRDIFVWEQATDEITRISQGNGAGDTDACSAGWTSKCSVAPIEPERPGIDNLISAKTGDVYFYSPEQLDPDNPGVLNQKNLYVYRNGAVHYVATLDENTEVDRMQISPDGQHAAFLTAARLTGYDNEGWREMYTFEPETGLVRCVSCDPTGAPPVVLPPIDDKAEGRAGAPSGDVLASQSGPFMSDDGRVAFTTANALAERDTNGLMDVYEFVDGRPHLISSGTSQTDKFSGAVIFPIEYTGLESFSADGRDLYFSTFDSLAPEDHNGSFLKFYDARTAGGFVNTAAELPCVAADECHGEESPAPPTPQVGSGAELGTDGNAKPAGHKSGKHKARRGRGHHSKHHHRRTGHGRRGNRHG